MSGKKTYDVVSIGTLTYDITQPLDDKTLTALGLEKGLSTIVSKEKFAKLIKHQDIALKSVGGVGANITIGIALNGGSSAMIGKIGKDKIGAEFIKSFKAQGVDFLANCHETEPSTALMSYITPDGERSFAVMLGASCDVGPEDIDETMIKNAKIVHIDTYLLQSPVGIEGMNHAIHLAQKNKKPVSISMNDENLMRRNKKIMRPILEQKADIIIGSMREFMTIFDVKTIDAAMKIARKLDAKITLTQGAKDVYTIENGKVTVVKVSPSKKVVDTCGAGDQFAAGVLKGLADGMNAAEAAKQGTLWAAHVIQKYGSLPTKPQKSSRAPTRRRKRQRSTFRKAA